MNEYTTNIDELLQGKTITIYWYLLTHGEAGIREIQRDLKISSPSTVSYHMNKLVNSKLVSKTKENDKYCIDEYVKTGIFGLYIKIGKIMVPRILFYLSFFFFGTILYLTLIFIRPGKLIIHFEDFMFLFFSISGILFFAYEAYRIWVMKPL